MRKILLWILFVNLSLAALPEQDIFTHGRLTVSPGGHFLQFEDGTPFFWLGDTGWELFHRLNLTEVNSYLEKRKEKGEYISACRDEMNRCILVYLPVGKTIAVKTGKMTCDKVACWWYNPRNGQAEKIGLLNRVDTMKFTPPTVGINNDLLLVIDNPEYNLGVPGICK